MRKTIVFLIPLILLASCGSTNPDPGPDPDPDKPQIEFSLEASKTKLYIDEKSQLAISLKSDVDISTTNFTYKSSDDDILEPISFSNCVITLLAHDLGNATITVTETTSQVSHSMNFRVESAFDGSITLNKKLINIEENKTFQLTADANQKVIDWESDDESVATVSNTGLVRGISSGSATITAYYHLAPNIKARCQVMVYEEGQFPDKVEMKQTYKDYAKNGYWENYTSTPSSGNVKLLIVPIWFTDSNNYIIDNEHKEYVREDIKTAYLGTNEEIGYRSVKTYYEEESSGKLSINGLVTDWYDTYEPSENYSVDSSQTRTLLSSVVNWLRTYPNINLKDYDSDSDGYLDGVIMIYARPAYPRLAETKNNFWAYCGHSTSVPPDKEDPNGNVYFWASYDFIYSSNADGNHPYTQERTGTYYGGGNDYRQLVDPITYIHEMGHMFGLYDYYDYTYSVSPAGAYTMQDENVSTHDPFSYIALNWADPYIPKESCTLTIGEFATTHDVILLTPEWNQYDSAFDEYILLELYNLTGLNEYYKDDWFKGIMLPNGIGIRVWHVDARLAANPKYGWYITSDVKDSNKVYKLCDNSHTKIESFPTDQRGSFLASNQNMLQLISHNPNTNHGSSRYYHFSNDDLFLENETFTIEAYKKQFINIDTDEYYTNDSTDIFLNNGKKLNWSFKVNKINTIDGFSTATITLNKLV